MDTSALDGWEPASATGTHDANAPQAPEPSNTTPLLSLEVSGLGAPDREAPAPRTPPQPISFDASETGAAQPASGKIGLTESEYRYAPEDVRARAYIVEGGKAIPVEPPSQLIASERSTPAAAAPPETTAPKQRQSRWPVIALIVASLGFAALIALGLNGKQRATEDAAGSETVDTTVTAPAHGAPTLSR